jgi:hypothetical protein
MHVSGIRVFSPPAVAKPTPAPSRQFSKSAVRDWYGKWVEEHLAAGSQTSRDQDVEAARAAGYLVPRDFLRELRRELAPPAWRRRAEAI